MRDLLANLDLVRFALEVGRVGVYLQDYISNEHVWSPVAYEIFGVSPDFTVSAESLLQIILSEDIPHVLRQVNAAHAQDSSVTDYRLQFRVRGEDGEIRHIEAHALLERDKQGRLVRERGVVRDISNLTVLKAQLVEAQREDVLGKVAAGIAHDLNNLLTAVKGHASLLSYQLNNGGGQADMEGLSVIEQAVDRAAVLTSKLLTLTPRHSSSPGAYDLNDSIVCLESMLSRVIEEDKHLLFEYGENIPPVLMDPVQIEQILLNLLLNARDATKPGDSIIVRTRCERTDAPELLGSRMTPGWAALIEVEDTGEGMTSEVLERSQEAFFTTKKLGTGLGLSSCRLIALEHDGWFSIKSEIGRGTTVFIGLPADPGATPRTQDRYSEPGGGLGKGVRVLVAEDDALVRDLAGMGLRGFDFDVVLARDSDEALAAAENASFDIVVSDVVMPRLSVSELREAFAKRLPKAPVLFVSGYPKGAGTQLSEILRERDGFLAKPYTPITLVNKIREMLSQG